MLNLLMLKICDAFESIKVYKLQLGALIIIK